MDKNRVSAVINGTHYTFLCEDSQQHIDKVAEVVNNKMSKIAISNNMLNLQRVSILTAVNIADELVKAQTEIERLRMEKTKNEAEQAKEKKIFEQLKVENERLKIQLNNRQRGEISAGAKSIR